MKTYLVDESLLRQVLDEMRDAAFDEECYTLNPDLAEAHDKLRTLLAKEPSEPVAWEHDDTVYADLTLEGEDVVCNAIPLYRKDSA